MKLEVQSSKTAWGSSIVLLQKEKLEGDIEIGIFSCEVGKALERHDHGQKAEWCFLIQGEADFDCDGDITHVKTGEFVYLPAGSHHTSYPTGSEPFTSVYIVCKDS